MAKKKKKHNNNNNNLNNDDDNTVILKKLPPYKCVQNGLNKILINNEDIEIIDETVKSVHRMMSHAVNIINIAARKHFESGLPLFVVTKELIVELVRQIQRSLTAEDDLLGDDDDDTNHQDKTPLRRSQRVAGLITTRTRPTTSTAKRLSQT